MAVRLPDSTLHNHLLQRLQEEVRRVLPGLPANARLTVESYRDMTRACEVYRARVDFMDGRRLLIPLNVTVDEDLLNFHCSLSVSSNDPEQVTLLRPPPAAVPIARHSLADLVDGHFTTTDLVWDPPARADTEMRYTVVRYTVDGTPPRIEGAAPRPKASRKAPAKPLNKDPLHVKARKVEIHAEVEEIVPTPRSPRRLTLDEESESAVQPGATPAAEPLDTAWWDETPERQSRVAGDPDHLRMTTAADPREARFDLSPEVAASFPQTSLPAAVHEQWLRGEGRAWYRGLQESVQRWRENTRRGQPSYDANGSPVAADDDTDDWPGPR